MMIMPILLYTNTKTDTNTNIDIINNNDGNDSGNSDML